jgi:hypothetical protein
MILLCVSGRTVRLETFVQFNKRWCLQIVFGFPEISRLSGNRTGYEVCMHDKITKKYNN